MYLGQYEHAEGVTFNSDRDLWHCRSVVGSLNKSKMSLIKPDRISGQRVSLPFLLASCSIHCHPAGPCFPFIPAHTRHPHACCTNRELNLKQEREQVRGGGRGLSWLLCHFMLTRCEVEWHWAQPWCLGAVWLRKSDPYDPFPVQWDRHELSFVCLV